MIYLYDPTTNIKTPTTYSEIAEMYGYSVKPLPSVKTKKKKLGKINCYIIDDKTTAKQRKELYVKETPPGEHWRIIEGSDDHFFISNYGRIKRKYSKGSIRFLLPYQCKGKCGLFIKTMFLNKYKEIKISKLVAHHFIRPARSGDILIYKNNINTDDFAGNLRYGTMREHGIRTGFKGCGRIKIVKLDPNTMEVIQEYRTIREASRMNHVSHQTINNYLKGRCKSCAGYVFGYAADYVKDSEEDKNEQTIEPTAAAHL